jgi:hypothetical protein
VRPAGDEGRDGKKQRNERKKRKGKERKKTQRTKGVFFPSSLHYCEMGKAEQRRGREAKTSRERGMKMQS